ncbi:MAG TPA: hypothetical protein VFU11_08620 [Solirubrobacterales bacterium]|nr:hypothetical protein [Solirubrobacterales bacterium]
MNIVLSYGLGVDSTALLLRWLEDPESRDFPLSELLVVTSMTGDEWPLTGLLVERHVLPRLRDAGVRFAQVARGGRLQEEGIVVLDDSDSPRRLHLAGAYKLSEEMTVAGTVPQTGGNRLCSMKFKGWVIDTYLEHHAPEATRHAFGYEAGEVSRARRCVENMPGRLAFGFGKSEGVRARRATEYDTTHRRAEFPLIEWDWDREACQRYIEKVTGVPDWPKSACVYCPFALTSRAGRERSLTRYDTRPQSALEALMLERRSLCLNPRGGLIAGKRLDELIASERPGIAAAFRNQLDAELHSVYDVKRVWLPKAGNPDRVGTVYRDLRVLLTGTRRECELMVSREGEVDASDGIERVYRMRPGQRLPRREHFLVAGPAGAEPKVRPGFSSAWEQLDHEQLALG